MTPVTASIFSDVTYCVHGQRPLQSFIRGRNVEIVRKGNKSGGVHVGSGFKEKRG